MPTILPDILRPGLRMVFCGSAAGRASAAAGAYYAGPGNRFWPMLAKTGLTPHLLDPQDFRSLPDHGLGLTDLCQSASGADRDLPTGADDPVALRRKIARYQPAVLAFVGKRPAKVFLGRARVETGLQADTVGVTQIFVLPSPSGAARGHWDEAPWFHLARLVSA